MEDTCGCTLIDLIVTMRQDQRADEDRSSDLISRAVTVAKVGIKDQRQGHLLGIQNAICQVNKELMKSSVSNKNNKGASNWSLSKNYSGSNEKTALWA